MPLSRAAASATADLDTLVVFAVVARERSLTRAAERLGVSQPAISARIHRLESHVGAPVLERLGRGVRLTAAGELLLPVAQRALELERETSELLAGLAGEERGLIRCAASTTIAGYVLPAAIARLRTRRPLVEVAVQVGNTADVAALVAGGELPWGLVEGPVDAGRFQLRRIADDELLLLVPPLHPWATGGEIEPAALLEQPFVGREAGSGTGAIYEAALAERGVRLRPTVRLADSRGIAAAVAAGAGVGIVSALVARPFLETNAVVAVQVTGLRLTRPLTLVQLPGRSLGRLDEELLSAMATAPSQRDG